MPTTKTNQTKLKEAILHKFRYIEIIDTISEGISGSVVFLVHIRRGEQTQGYSGMAFLKADTQKKSTQEYNLHHLAQTSCNQAFIPQIIYPPQHIVDDWYLILYEPAHQSTNSVMSLGRVISKNTVPIVQISNHIENLLTHVIACWHDVRDFSQRGRLRTIPELFRELINFGGKERFDSIEDRTDIYSLPGKTERLLTFRPGTKLELPNPIAYILDHTLWEDVKQIFTPYSPIHGDLHAGNIIVDTDTNNSPPWLIDLAYYEESGVSIFDLAYLELDLLTRSLATVSRDSDEAWEDWVAITKHLSRDILPATEPERRNTKVPWELVKPIREYLNALLQQAESRPGIQDDLKIIWWVCTVVAGTLFARRSQVNDRETRIVTLLYAAQCLETLNDLTHPIAERNQASEVWWKEKPWNQSPFPGLKAFNVRQSAIFYGRNREIKDLASMVEENRFTMVAGASGSGKSSLVGAGLIAQLQNNIISGSYRWRVLHFTPDEDPFGSLRAVLKKTLCPQERKLATRLRDDPFLIDRLSQTYLGKDGQLLLFIDQFEELFTLTEKNQITPFIAFLASTPQMTNVRAVATMRNDFYPRCFEHNELLVLIQRDYKLGAPSVPALKEMIEGPARKASVTFEDGLVDLILEETGTDPGALALMAYTLEKLYNSREHGHHLTRKTYDKIGGVRGAIATQADRTFETLSDAAKASLGRVFKELVSVEGGNAIRQRAPVSRFVSEAEHELIDAFQEARLLVKDQDDKGKPIVEIAHEALLRSWPKLSEWIEGAKDDIRLNRQLRVAINDWKNHNKSDGYLWRHEQLQAVYDMMERLTIDFQDDPDALEFITPEAKRRLDDFVQLDGEQITVAGYKQRTIVDRWKEIGVASIPAMVVARRHRAATKPAIKAIDDVLADYDAEVVFEHLLALLEGKDATERVASERYLEQIIKLHHQFDRAIVSALRKRAQAPTETQNVLAVLFKIILPKQDNRDQIRFLAAIINSENITEKSRTLLIQALWKNTHSNIAQAVVEALSDKNYRSVVDYIVNLPSQTKNMTHFLLHTWRKQKPGANIILQKMPDLARFQHIDRPLEQFDVELLEAIDRLNTNIDTSLKDSTCNLSYEDTRLLIDLNLHEAASKIILIRGFTHRTSPEREWLSDVLAAWLTPDAIDTILQNPNGCKLKDVLFIIGIVSIDPTPKRLKLLEALTKHGNEVIRTRASNAIDKIKYDQSFSPASQPNIENIDPALTSDSFPISFGEVVEMPAWVFDPDEKTRDAPSQINRREGGKTSKTGKLMQWFLETESREGQESETNERHSSRDDLVADTGEMPPVQDKITTVEEARKHLNHPNTDRREVAVKLMYDNGSMVDIKLLLASQYIPAQLKAIELIADMRYHNFVSPLKTLLDTTQSGQLRQAILGAFEQLDTAATRAILAEYTQQ